MGPATRQLGNEDQNGMIMMMIYCNQARETRDYCSKYVYLIYVFCNFIIFLGKKPLLNVNHHICDFQQCTEKKRKKEYEPVASETGEKVQKREGENATIHQ